MKRAVACPGCGLTIVMDIQSETKASFRHENPMCEEFRLRAIASGFDVITAPWVEVVDPVTGAVKEPVKA